MKRAYVIDGEMFRIYEAKLTSHEADLVRDVIDALDRSCGNCLDYPYLQLKSEADRYDAEEG